MVVKGLESGCKNKAALGLVPVTAILKLDSIKQ